MARKIKLLFWEQRCQEIERHTVADAVRCAAVDGLNLDEREVLLAFFWRTDSSCHSVAGFKTEQFNLRLANINVVG